MVRQGGFLQVEVDHYNPAIDGSLAPAIDTQMAPGTIRNHQHKDGAKKLHRWKGTPCLCREEVRDDRM